MGLIMWISFIDDMLVVCNEKYMDDVKQKWVLWWSTLVQKST